MLEQNFKEITDKFWVAKNAKVTAMKTSLAETIFESTSLVYRLNG